MKRNQNVDDDDSEKLSEAFSRVMEFIFATWGDSAFHNLSPSDPNRLVKKFSPTIFDSISNATAMALEQGMDLAPGDAEVNRRRLMQDNDYRTAISKETMKKDSIEKRISLAYSYLFGYSHEQ